MTRDHWRTVSCLIAALMLGALASRSAQAVILFERGSNLPVKGYMREYDDIRVVIDELLPDGTTRERIFPRASIESMLIAVAPERLASLRPENPRDYRAYADELSEKKEDPDARRTALRLYLLAAYLDSENLGRSCLLSMTYLAQSPEEQRKYYAMVFLLDPDHNRDVLRTPEVTRPGPALDVKQRDLLHAGLRALRNGQQREAMNFARRGDFRELLAGFAQTLTVEQFQEAIQSSRLSDAMLRKLLLIELATLPRTVELPRPRRDEAAQESWSAAELSAAGRGVTRLSLDSITPFNPRYCLYQDGKWVLPKE